MSLPDTNPFEPAPGIIRDVPLALIFDSPAQALETYDEAYIAELGASIKALGYNHTPILLRPRPDGAPGYESAFGHCRRRACAWAGLPTCRAEIVDMTDMEVAQAQLSENLNRRIASPLEEATRFDRLMRIHKLTVPQLMENFGKSKGYIYGRLSLLKLSASVRQAMAQGLQTETALAIAKHANERIQQLAIAKVRRSNGDWMPTLEAKQVLNDAFIIRLSSAPFDLKDDKLLKRAGACSECPNCAANNPALADLPADSCVDKDCFDIKCEEHWQHVVMQLQDDGHNVLQDDDAIRDFRVSGHVPLTASYRFGDRSHLVTDMLSARPDDHPKPALTYVAPDGEEPRGYITTADLNALMVALRLVPATPPAPAPAPSQAANAPAVETATTSEKPANATAVAGERSAAGKAAWPFPSQPPSSKSASGTPGLSPEEVAVEAYWKARILPAVLHAAAARERTTDDLRVIAANAIDFAQETGVVVAAELMGWPDQTIANAEEWLRSKLPELTADQLGLLTTLLGIALDAPGYGAEQFKHRIQLARAYGVNVLDHVDQPAAEADADPDEDDDDSEPPPAASKSPSRTPARYRNPATGETWSGRGLQPRWLKAAIAAGGKLSDFEAVKASI